VEEAAGGSTRKTRQTRWMSCAWFLEAPSQKVDTSVRQQSNIWTLGLLHNSHTAR